MHIITEPPSAAPLACAEAADVQAAQGATPLERALALLARGLSLVDVPLPDGRRHDGKVPVRPWRALQHRQTTEAEARDWFARPANIAIITGEISGVVVVDVDSRPAMEFAVLRLPYTPWQTKTRKGFHLFYRHPGVRVGNRTRIDTGDGRLAIDVRGDGGYVIAPGSSHASGAVYLEAGDWSVPREQLPRFWPGWLERPRRASAQRRTAKLAADAPVLSRVRAYLRSIPAPVIGAGSDQATLYAACRLVRGFGLSVDEAEALLWEWAGGRPGWTRTWIAKKVQSAERYGSEPIGALR